MTNSSFLRLIYNNSQKNLGKEELDPLEFDDHVREKNEALEIDPSFLDRYLNDGFSGGEKRETKFSNGTSSAKLAILDETDSGLDIDALRVVSEGVNKLRVKENSIILVTHYQRLLNYIVPDFVHEGQRKIIKTGNRELARARRKWLRLDIKKCTIRIA